MIIVARVDVGCLLLGDRLNLSTDIVQGLYALLKCNKSQAVIFLICYVVLYLS